MSLSRRLSRGGCAAEPPPSRHAISGRFPFGSGLLGRLVPSSGVLGALVLAGVACERESASASAKEPLQLPPELAGQRLAKVGDREIVLRDYAAALERMGKLEALRYQTDDRRGDLLDELINVELLAREAEARGIDREPRTQVLVLQMLKAEALRLLEADLPGPAAFEPQEVRAFFAEHREEFFEPERRRLSVLLFVSRASAERALRRAIGGSMSSWVELARELDPAAVPPSNRHEAELLSVPGDLGMVGAGSTGAGSGNAGVGPALRDAVFELEDPGTVLGRVVELPKQEASAPRPAPDDGRPSGQGAIGRGRFALVRWVSRVPAREPPFEEVRTLVAARLFEQHRAEARKQLLLRLRKEIPVHYDRAALRDAGIQIADEP